MTKLNKIVARYWKKGTPALHPNRVLWGNVTWNLYEFQEGGKAPSFEPRVIFRKPLTAGSRQLTPDGPAEGTLVLGMNAVMVNASGYFELHSYRADSGEFECVVMIGRSGAFKGYVWLAFKDADADNGWRIVQPNEVTGDAEEFPPACANLHTFNENGSLATRPAIVLGEGKFLNLASKIPNQI